MRKQRMLNPNRDKKDFIQQFTWLEWLFIIFLGGIFGGISTFLSDTFGINKEWLLFFYLVPLAVVYKIYQWLKIKKKDK